MTRDELLCPKCGAPLPEGAARATAVCGFCGVVSMPAAPKIVERVIERVVVVQSASEAATASGVRVCPRCTAPLFEGAAKDVVLHGCGVCGGIWLDNEGAQRVVKETPGEVMELALRAERHATQRADTRPAGMPCPECRAPLSRVLSSSGVQLDVCTLHGTWFDRHELMTVIHSLRVTTTKKSALPSEEELLRAAAAPPSPGDKAFFESANVVSSQNDLERTATRTALGVTLGLLGAALAGASSRD